MVLLAGLFHEFYGSIYYSAVNDSISEVWAGQRRNVYDFRGRGCYLKVLKGSILINLEDWPETGYFMGTTATRSVIRHWYPWSPKIIGHCTTARFNEEVTMTPDNKLSYDSIFSLNMDKLKNIDITVVNYQQHAIIDNPVHKINVKLKPIG